ncbi:hypothetical protein GQ53DRAFT_184490 [Thozetella sp. PMI_491]|nr:hypothetical protein GQ53DRAFT_184490 [Thozetella sp. PMI_491]
MLGFEPFPPGHRFSSSITSWRSTRRLADMTYAYKILSFDRAWSGNPFSRLISPIEFRQEDIQLCFKVYKAKLQDAILFVSPSELDSMQTLLVEGAKESSLLPVGLMILALGGLSLALTGNRLEALQGGFHACSQANTSANYSPTSLDGARLHLLTGIYFAMSGEPMDSFGYIQKAAAALIYIIDSEFPSLREKGPETELENQVLFMFWTCFQIERDALDELPLEDTPRLSAKMVYPSAKLAKASGHSIAAVYEHLAHTYLRKVADSIYERLYQPKPQLLPTLLTEFNELRPSVDQFHFPEGCSRALEYRYYRTAIALHRPFLYVILDACTGGSLVVHGVACIKLIIKCLSLDNLTVINSFALAHAYGHPPVFTVTG